MDKETFYQALEKNFPPIDEWKITIKESNKLLNKLKKLGILKDIFNWIPSYPDLISDDKVYNSDVNQSYDKKETINKYLVNNPYTKVFFQKAGKPSCFNYIMDPLKGKYYSIHSKKGKSILKKYRNKIINRVKI